LNSLRNPVTALRHLGTVTQGATEEEAFRNIDEVIHMIVGELHEDGTPLPNGPGDDVEVLEGTRATVTV